jgi:hypothetical protein
MNITQAKDLRKWDRVRWHDKEAGVGPFNGTVVDKKTKEMCIAWDGEEREEFVSLSKDDIYFITFLERENE